MAFVIFFNHIEVHTFSKSNKLDSYWCHILRISLNVLGKTINTQLSGMLSDSFESLFISAVFEVKTVLL